MGRSNRSAAAAAVVKKPESAPPAGEAAGAAPAAGAASEAPGSAQFSGAEEPVLVAGAAVAALKAAFAALPAAMAGVVEFAKGASPTERTMLRQALRVVQDEGVEEFARVAMAVQDFMAAPDEVELVKVEARSRSGNEFRRAGFVWDGGYRTVHVPADVAERLCGDPNLQVKGGANV